MKPAVAINFEMMDLNDLADRLQSRPKKKSYKRDLSRFQELLTKRGEDDGSIQLQEHWTLYYSLIGNIGLQKHHLQRAIELIMMLLELGGPVADIDHEYLEKAKGKLNKLA